MKLRKPTLEEVMIGGAVIGLVALLVFISGCATTAPDLIKATKACEANGGLVSIQPKYNKTVRAGCANGANFVIKADE